MFKYESGQLPDALNLFFVKNRSVHNYNTRNKNKLCPTVANHAYRDFRLVDVHVRNYIGANLKMDTSFSTFHKAQKNVFNQIFFGLI